MTLKLRKLIFLAGIIGFFVCTLLFIYYPAAPRSLLGWLTLICVGLPVWFFLEWLGERVLGMNFFTKLSSSMRVIIAVPLVIVLMVVCAFLVQLVQKLVSIT